MKPASPTRARSSRLLLALCRQLGVTFQYGASIASILTHGGKVAGVRTSTGRTLTGDAYVVALGSYSPRLLGPIGIRLPVYPVKGYSLTLPITDPAGAPESTVMDETHKVAITRLGNRIRAGGMAELDGYNTRLRQSRRATLEHVVRDLYPRGGDIAQASFWCGLRPMTPDGPPLVCRAGAYENLFLNTGHGTLGWTMSCGSGRVLADLISGRQPEIDASALGIERYARHHSGGPTVSPPLPTNRST